MKVKFNFNLKAWISNLEIEGASYKDAENKLYKMSIEELLNKGYVDDHRTEDPEGEIVSANIDVLVDCIDYNIDEADLAEGVTVEQALSRLPDELKLSIIDVAADDNLESLVKKYVEDKTGTSISHFDFKILKEY